MSKHSPSHPADLGQTTRSEEYQWPYRLGFTEDLDSGYMGRVGPIVQTVEGALGAMEGAVEGMEVVVERGMEAEDVGVGVVGVAGDRS
ncbi:hypothetical protein FRC17_000236 [Serendipita sp. 399]|nr:hypothetical protein FRC17_000236 [Serendipita sp. 399]